MNHIKRLAVIFMCFAFLASLFGCNKQKQPDSNTTTPPTVTASGEWKSFTISKSSMDNSASFWFTVTEEGEDYILTGICRDYEGNEYDHEEEGITLTDETVKILRDYKLEKMPDERKSPLDDMVLDADMESFTVTFDDGTFVKKAVPYDISSEVESLLRDYLIGG